MSIPERNGRRLLCACTVALLGCGHEVTVPAPTPSTCHVIEDGALLSSLEFADLVECHYPASDGWQLLVVRAAPIHTSSQSVGRARGWNAVLAHGAAGEVLTVRYGANTYPEDGLTWKLADGGPFAACGATEQLTVAESIPIIADILDRHPDHVTPQLETSHACVEGGTCGRVIVTTHSAETTTSFVYDADGTYLFTSGLGSPEVACDDP